MKKYIFTIITVVFFFASAMTSLAAYQPAIRAPFYDANTNTLSLYVADLGGSALAVAGFEYGLDENYGYVSGITMLTAPGYVTANPSLTCNSNYHFRAFVTNTGGTTSGTTLSNDMIATCAGIPEMVPAQQGSGGSGEVAQPVQEEPAATPETPAAEVLAEETLAPAPEENSASAESAPETPQAVVEETPVIEPTPEPIPEIIEEPVTEEIAPESATEETSMLEAAAGLSGFVAQPWLWGVLGILVVLLVYRTALKRARKWEKEDGGDSSEIS